MGAAHSCVPSWNVWQYVLHVDVADLCIDADRFNSRGTFGLLVDDKLNALADKAQDLISRQPLYLKYMEEINESAGSPFACPPAPIDG